MPTQKEFKVNEYISLKLEHGKTNIYLKGQLFNQCKFLLLNIPVDKISNFDEIESIDEAADQLGWIENGQLGLEDEEYSISSQDEFWGHCSNIQAFVENNYDTRLLHSNLSFPLLKKLTEIGDPLAKKVFKKEIADRFVSGYPTVIKYIVEVNLLNSFSRKEKKLLISKYIIGLLESIEKLPDEEKFDGFTNLLGKIPNKNWIEKNFHLFEEYTEKYPSDDKYYALCELFDAIDIKKIKNEFFATIEKFQYGSYNWGQYLYEKGYFKNFDVSVLLNNLDKIPNVKITMFHDLLASTIVKGMLEEKFLDFLVGIDKLPLHIQYDAFLRLIKAIRSTRVLVEHFSLFEKYFFNLLNGIAELPDKPHFEISKLIDVIKEFESLDNYKVFVEENYPVFRDMIKQLHINNRYMFKKLFDLLKDTDLWIEKFPDLLEWISILPIRQKLDQFCDLIYTIKKTKYLDKFYSLIVLIFSDLINEYKNSNDIDKYIFLIKLIPAIKGTKMLHEYYSFIDANFPDLLNVFSKKHKANKYSTYSTFINLIYALCDTELIQSKFLYLLDTYGNFSEPYNKYRVFGMLMEAINVTRIKSKYLLLIENKFLDLLNGVDSKYIGVIDLIKAVKNTNLMDKYFPLIQSKVLGLLNEVDITYDKFTDLIHVIKGTKLMRENQCIIINRFPKFLLKPRTKEILRQPKKSELSQEQIKDMYNKKLLSFSISEFTLSLILKKLYDKGLFH